MKQLFKRLLNYRFDLNTLTRLHCLIIAFLETDVLNEHIFVTSLAPLRQSDFTAIPLKFRSSLLTFVVDCSLVKTSQDICEIKRSFNRFKTVSKYIRTLPSLL